jgi:outer membrane protein OmpA-like peptidoglycan-associated protein
MLNQRNSRLFVTGLLLAVLPALGCAPRVFADTSGIAINGTPPPPVEEAPPPPKRVEVRDNQIVINEKVQFEYNSAKILEVSHSLLDEVAKVIKEHPQIQLIEVQGHASAEGSDDYNLKLSDKRARAVHMYLIKKAGIAETLLQSKGYGETVPVADNETEEGKEKNRRVEFHILKQEVKQTKVEVDDKGNEKVVEGG